MTKEIIGIMLGLGMLWSGAAQALAAEAAAGKAAYEKSCAGCHGADGKGNPAMAKVLGEKGLNIVGKETKEKSDAQLLKIIAEGSGKMPASKLTKDEQKQTLGYVRSLAK
ncbi:MAG TPA: cytochrome c [Candidatus Binatia bacterium]|nr:cytochrome c [Candidatus Binatia bacterium]